MNVRAVTSFGLSESSSTSPPNATMTLSVTSACLCEKLSSLWDVTTGTSSSACSFDVTFTPDAIHTLGSK